MTENRRRAWRLTLRGAGRLATQDFRVSCVVENISVLGAKVVLTSVLAGSLDPPPEEVTLSTLVSGQQVSLDGEIVRIERHDDDLILGICFFNGESVGLGWLINEAQREQMSRSVQIRDPDRV